MDADYLAMLLEKEQEENERLRARIAAMREALVWLTESDDFQNECGCPDPECGLYKGHTDKCRIAALLKESEE